jgi:hypothetical protein
MASACPGPKPKVTTTAGTLTWVALGDSYSAGVGDPTGPNGCGDGHPYASYASRAEAVFAATSVDGLKSFAMYACGGAVSSQIEQNQMPHVVDADIVTLTDGGNDIGFSDFGKACFGINHKAICPSQDQENDVLDVGGAPGHATSWPEMHQRLVMLFTDVLDTMDSKGKTSGQLYVLPYPIPFDLAGLSHPTTLACLAVRARMRLSSKTYAPAFLANALAGKLDTEIEDAVSEVAGGSHGKQIHFVDWRTPAGAPQVQTMLVDGVQRQIPTNPSGICSRVAMTNFYKETLGQYKLQNSFHPTAHGYTVGATILRDAIRGQFDWETKRTHTNPSYCDVIGQPSQSLPCTSERGP